MKKKALLSFNNISKSYKDKKHVFEAISLDIMEGERVGIIGANGSGKSTFLKLLLGQEQPDNGIVSRNININQIAYLPQDYRSALFPWLTVRANLSLLLDTSSTSHVLLTIQPEIEAQAKKLFEKSQILIPFDKFPHQLSGGEQQALLLVQSFIRKPTIFIADEPFSAIDFNRKEIVITDFIKWIEEENVTSIIVSHDIEEAVYLSDRIIILSKNERQIIKDIKINFPFPRKPEIRFSSAFQDVIGYIKTNFE